MLDPELFNQLVDKLDRVNVALIEARGTEREPVLRIRQADLLIDIHNTVEAGR